MALYRPSLTINRPPICPIDQTSKSQEKHSTDERHSRYFLWKMDERETMMRRIVDREKQKNNNENYHSHRSKKKSERRHEENKKIVSMFSSSCSYSVWIETKKVMGLTPSTRRRWRDEETLSRTDPISGHCSDIKLTDEVCLSNRHIFQLMPTKLTFRQ